MKKLLTVPQAAQSLNVTPDWVRKAIRSGRLAATNLSPSGQRPYYVIAPDALREYKRRPKLKPGPKAK
jgi:excisionase family DNA binding protein